MIVAGIVVLNLLQSGSPDDDVRRLEAAARDSIESTTGQKVPSLIGSSRSSAKAGSKQATKPGTKTTAKQSAKQSAKPSGSKAAATKPAAPADAPNTEPAEQPAGEPAAERQPLTVLNSSRRKGLAAGAAEDFTRAGWPIHLVGNTTYRARITTVYYVPGQEAAARRLMAEFPAIQRMLLRPLRLPGKGLTVVVTREYPG